MNIHEIVLIVSDCF